jgi:predicted ribosome-associated RNA-binding protein Tma20
MYLCLTIVIYQRVICKYLHTLLNEVESSTPHDESKENYQKCTPVKFVIILNANVSFFQITHNVFPAITCTFV